MIPVEDYGPSVRSAGTGITTASAFIDDAPVLLGQLYKEHAYEHYKYLTTGENMSPESQKALMLAVYKGSDLFYNNRAAFVKQATSSSSEFSS